MKDFFKNIQTLFIIVLLAIILLMHTCNKSKEPTEPKVITKVDIKYDTVETITETYIPKWKTKIVTKIDTFLESVDTLSILKDYHTKYYYSDTFKVDTVGYAVINDTITQNKILSRNIKTNIIIPTITITKKIYLNEDEFYLGVGLQGKTDQLNYLGGELLWKSKNKQAYGFGVGINQNFQPILSGRMYWKIK